MGTSINLRFVTLAQAGVQSFRKLLDSRFHGNDIFIHWAIVVIPVEAGIQYLWCNE